MRRTVLVTGAGGFIGHHLVNYLVGLGYWVRGVDLKLPLFESTTADEFILGDLRDPETCRRATEGINEIYHFAADMGGIGYISSNHATIMSNNVQMNTLMLEASRQAGVERFIFSSSACVYPSYRQTEADVRALREEDAYPAEPDEGYGWEKLFTERLCQYYRHDYGLETRIARFHNVFGPFGTYEGGREKAPAAICRKVALAAEFDEIEVWGDGEQTRSFLYVDDCVRGVYLLAQSSYPEPVNIGSDRLVSINNLVDIVAGIAGKTLRKRYLPGGPQGVRGRNSDNTRVNAILGWQPSVSLEEGLDTTFHWIEGEVMKPSPLIHSDAVAN